MAISAVFSLATRLDVSKNDNGVARNGVYEPFSYRFSNVFVDKKIGAATVTSIIHMLVTLVSNSKTDISCILIPVLPTAMKWGYYFNLRLLDFHWYKFKYSLEMCHFYHSLMLVTTCGGHQMMLVTMLTVWTPHYFPLMVPH